MATTRTTLLLSGSIQQVLYRQAWVSSARKMQIAIIFPSSPVDGINFPQATYQIWLLQGVPLSSTVTFESGNHTSYRKCWSPRVVIQAPLASAASLDYSDAIFIRGLNSMVGKTIIIDYIDAA